MKIRNKTKVKKMVCSLHMIDNFVYGRVWVSTSLIRMRVKWIDIGWRALLNAKDQSILLSLLIFLTCLLILNSDYKFLGCPFSTLMLQKKYH